jgi:hypothetical protein
VIDFGFKNDLKESSTEKLGIFYSIKNRIKPFVKELIFIFATPLKTLISKEGIGK